MYQIKVNGVLLPTIYWYFRDAMDACDIERERGYAVKTDIIRVG